MSNFLHDLKYSIQDLSIDTSRIAFSADWKSYHWLKYFIELKTINNKPIYIIDNHNYALYFWYKYFIQNNLLQSSDKILWNPPNLIHIDQHTDRKPNSNQFNPLWLTGDYSAQILDFVQNKTNVWNFLPPLLKGEASETSGGLLPTKNYHEIRTEYSFKHFQALQSSYILDIDLDFFAPEMWINFQKSIPKLQKLINNANLVTIATSPYFLDQNLAISMLNQLL